MKDTIMGNPTFISVTLPNYRVAFSGAPADVPTGHGGFIIVNTDGTGTYYEYGLYDNGTTGVITNSSIGPKGDGNIRDIQLSGLQFDSSGNVTQASLQSALDHIYSGTGLYGTMDTGMVIASTFTISQSQYDAIVNTFIPNQKANINNGT